MKKKKLTLQVLALLAFASTANAEEKEKKFEVYGFAQVDYIQDFKRVNPAWDTTLRPSRIPTEDGLYGSDGQALLSVNQSRFGVKANLPLEGESLSTKFEFDLFGVGPDEGKTTIRLRHAYGQWGNWLGGQTHSLFMDVDAFPNVIDYWGPAGMVFLRNPQIRYWLSQGSDEIAIAIEKPSNDIDSGKFRTIGDELGAEVKGDEKLPDLTAMARVNRDWGHFQASGILRSIGFETIGTSNNNPKSSELGWGINLSSNFNFLERDKLIMAVVYGQGIASYMNDGGTDLGPDGTLSNPRAKAVPLMGLNLYYDHYWSEKYSSSIGYARTQVDNTDLQADDAFNKGEYASLNLLHYPRKNIMYGAEVLWGSRTDNDGAYGDDLRTQVSFKYNFSSLDFI